MTPTSSQRVCRMASSVLRAMPEKPWPLEVMTRSRTWTSMSSQWARLAVMRANEAASAAWKFPIV